MPDELALSLLAIGIYCGATCLAGLILLNARRHTSKLYQLLALSLAIESGLVLYLKFYDGADTGAAVFAVMLIGKPVIFVALLAIGAFV